MARRPMDFREHPYSDCTMKPRRPLRDIVSPEFRFTFEGKTYGMSETVGAKAVPLHTDVNCLFIGLLN